MSESLFKTPFAALTLSTVSSFVLLLSANSVGASFIGLTVISKVEFELLVPSVAVYVICGTAPLKLFAGVNK